MRVKDLADVPRGAMVANATCSALASQEADANGNGTLDHAEVVALVSQIPGLEKDEQ